MLTTDTLLHAVSAQEDIAKLLRFESSALPAGQQTNLMEYSSRMKAGTRNIYYLCAPNRHLAECSPYYEAMKQKDMEVRGGVRCAELPHQSWNERFSHQHKQT